MKAAIKFFIYMTLILVVMYSSGCAGEGQELTSKQPPTLNNAVDNQTAGSGQEAPSSTAADQAAPSATTSPNPAGGATTTIVLYFADADGYLQAEQRTINKTAGIARQAIHELCQGPCNQGLGATIPDRTQLLDINIQDGLCTVNFSQELVANHSGGSGSENTTVYSIVNTLTQFSSIEQVQILVDGAIVESIAGHLDVSVPLTRDSDLIRAGSRMQQGFER